MNGFKNRLSRNTTASREALARLVASAATTAQAKTAEE